MNCILQLQWLQSPDSSPDKLHFSVEINQILLTDSQRTAPD